MGNAAKKPIRRGASTSSGTTNSTKKQESHRHLLKPLRELIEVPSQRCRQGLRLLVDG